MSNAFVDNVIWIGGKYLPVEVKLSVPVQTDIRQQVRKYCHNSSIVLDSRKFLTISDKQIYSEFCLIIDTEKVYIYEYSSDSIQILLDLNYLQSKQDILALKQTFSTCLC